MNVDAMGDRRNTVLESTVNSQAGKPALRRWRGRFRRLLSVTLCGLLATLAGWLALPLVPLPAKLMQPLADDREWGSAVQTSAAMGSKSAGLEFLDREGRPLRALPDDQSYFSKPVPYGSIPQTLVQATLAAEDKRFWSHHGVDWRATTRAAISLARYRRVTSGGSTITQQLIKRVEPRPRTLRTKLIESVQALRLEQLWSKERILVEYLNGLDYGNLRAGCVAAAEFYFHKPVQDLSLAEAAFLAALPQAPSRLNPRFHFERARHRQRWILGQMLADGYVTAAEASRALEEPLRLAAPTRTFEAPHFVDLVAHAARHGFADGAPGAVRTTLDLLLNQIVDQTLRRQLDQLRSQHARNGAVVVIENRTGDVLALVGSDDYFAPEAGQVNGAWAPRSAGSTFKPFTYLLAFEQGATPASVVADTPADFPTSSGLFHPVNYNHRCHGPTRYRVALANSFNISAVKVLASIGGPATLQQALQDCGLTTLNQQAEFYGLGLTIGNAETRLLELVNAYACLARLGLYQPYRLLATASTRTVTNAPGKSRRVFGAAEAYLVADILSDNAARALAFGPDSDLRFDFPVACKTGTSSDFRDNWAIGYTPEFTVGVWVGNFDGSPMEHSSGVTGAAPTLHDIFVHLHDRRGTSWYTPPEGVVEKRVHPVTGKLLATDRTAGVPEKFAAGRLPAAEAGEDFDSAGRVRLAAEYGEWLASGDNWLGERAYLGGERPAGSTVNLLWPLPGATFYLDPDLPAGSRRIPLRARGPQPLSWESDTLRCQSEAGETFAILAEGRHRLRARHAITGAVAETWIVVKGL